jgi:signal transduction histidine kinase
MRRTATQVLKHALDWANPRVAAGGRALRAGLVQVATTPDPPPVWRGKWRRRLAYATAGTLTVVLVPAAFAGLFAGLSFPAGLQAILMAAAVGLVIRYPLLSWRLAWASLLLSVIFNNQTLLIKPWNPIQLPLLLATFWAAGSRHGRPLIWWTLAFSMLPVWLSIGGVRPETGRIAATVAFTAIAIAVDSLGSRRRAQRDLAEQAELTELEQARRAVLTERTRIARELHDVVAHHMSLIAVRAETAPYRLSEVDESARAEFLALSGAAREALTDMRRLLGVLRDEGPAGRAPQPQLPDLRELVASARLAGMAVDLSLPAELAGPADLADLSRTAHLSGPINLSKSPDLGTSADPSKPADPAQPAGMSGVPASVGVCVYRIVQESLSNASRHAPGAAVTVEVDRDESALWLRVANGPGRTRRRADESHGPGQGLVGMHERVALLGGELSAGLAPGGAFIVAAQLPLGVPASQPVAVAAEPRQPA